MTERATTPLLRPLLMVALALLLPACTTLGPDYEPPGASELDSWDPGLHGLGPSAAEQQQVELAFWWRIFDDPVLEQLIRIAEKNNRQLQVAGLRVLQSRAMLGIAEAGLYPQSQQATANATWFNQQSEGNHTGWATWGLGISAGWELDFWGRFRRSIESADAAFFSSLEAQRAMQVLVKAQVASLYLSWRVFQELIDIAEKNAKLQKRSYEIAEELYRAGNTSELDYQQARTQYLATLSAIPQLELSRTQTLNALAVVLGRAPGDIPELEAGNYRLPQVDSAQVNEIPARLLLRRPDIRASAWAVAAQSAQIGVAEADLYPAISLLGSLGWSASSLHGSPDTGLLSIGPSLRWNIFDWGMIRNNVRLQDARLQELMAQYQDRVLQAALEVDNAAIGVVKTAEQTRLLEETVVSAKRALEIANVSYKEGYAGFQRVLDAQRSLLTQENRLVSTRGENIGYLVSLYKGLGGGWSAADMETLVPKQTLERMKRRTDWGELLDRPLPQPPSPFDNPARNPEKP